jgi:taurine dehydrogenase small subunit
MKTTEDTRETTNRSVVQAQFDGFVRHDLDAIMATFAQDCSYDQFSGNAAHGKRFEGRADIRRAFEKIFIATPRCTFRNPVLVVDGDTVVAKWTFVLDGHAKKSPLEIEGIDLFELEDGKIVRKSNWMKTRIIPINHASAYIARRLAGLFR